MNHICPTCGSDDVHHSGFRSFGEKLRFNLTGKEPFRCYACGWRDWLRDGSSEEAPPPDVHEPPADDTDTTDIIRR